MSLSKSWWREFTPLAFIPILWLFRPLATSPWIDASDTPHYVDYLGGVGFRFPVTAFVKSVMAFGGSPEIAALILNSLALFYAAFLTKQLLSVLKVRLEFQGWLLLAASPIMILAKNNLFTDLYAGLLATHAILQLEQRRDNALQSATNKFRSFLMPAFLAVFSMNVKETALLVFAPYGLFFVLRERAWPTLFRSISLFVFALSLWWTASRLAYVGLMGDLFWDYKMILAKPKGGNSPTEIMGTKASVPVPLVFYHLFSQLKTVGRFGLPGLAALLAIWPTKKLWPGQLYALGLFMFSLLAVSGMFTLERYFAVFLPIQLALFGWALMWIAPCWRPPVIALGLLLSIGNYLARYFVLPMMGGFRP